MELRACAFVNCLNSNTLSGREQFCSRANTLFSRFKVRKSISTVRNRSRVNGAFVIIDELCFCDQFQFNIFYLYVLSKRYLQSLPKGLGTPSNLRYASIFFNSFPGYSYFRTHSPRSNVDNSEKYQEVPEKAYFLS